MVSVVRSWLSTKLLVLAIVVVMATLFTGGDANASTNVTVGNALSSRSVADTAATTFVSAPGFGATAVDHTLTTWSFFAHIGTTNRSITPLLLESTGGTNYVLRAIGQTRQVGSGGIAAGAANSGLAFNVQAGDATIYNSNFLFGWKDGTPTSANQGVISFDVGGASSVTTLTAPGVNSARNLTLSDIDSSFTFTNGPLFRTYSFDAKAIQMACTAPSGATGDLVGYWRAQGNACDSADGNNGNLNNGAGFAPGKVGQAFEFNGINQVVTIPDSNNLDLSSITVKSWVKADNLGSGSVWDIIATRWFGGSLSWHLAVNDGKLQADISSNCSTLDNAALRGATSLNTNTWYHVALTIDGTANVARLYLNGNLDGQFNITGLCSTSNSNFQISDARAGGFGWDGLIDEVKVYNRVHTAQEIQAQYNKESNGPVSLWPAEGNAADLIDGNNGTLVGDAA